MNEMITKKLAELENNQEFTAKMQAAGSEQELMAVLMEYGIEASASENGELSEDALDNVSGGWLWDLIKKWHKRRSKKNEDDINDILNGLFD